MMMKSNYWAELPIKHTFSVVEVLNLEDMHISSQFTLRIALETNQ